MPSACRTRTRAAVSGARRMSGWDTQGGHCKGPCWDSYQLGFGVLPAPLCPVGFLSGRV